jgi:hypothetical protein
MSFFTVGPNPDYDINTILKNILDHRGFWSLHNPLWWIFIFIPLFNCGDFMIGGVIAIGGHLGADFIKGMI